MKNDEDVEKVIEEVFTILGDNGSIWYGIDKTTAIIFPSDLNDPKKCVDKMRPVDVKSLKEWMRRKATNLIQSLLASARREAKREVLEKMENLLIRNSDVNSQYTHLTKAYHVICLKGELDQFREELKSEVDNEKEK